MLDDVESFFLQLTINTPTKTMQLNNFIFIIHVYFAENRLKQCFKLLHTHLRGDYKKIDATQQDGNFGN